MTRFASIWTVALALAACGDDPNPPQTGDESPCATDDGQCIFRNDTFGDEQLWTDTLRLHELVQQLPPTMALGVGLKVDADAVPAGVLASADLSDPATTVALIQLNAVVGVRGNVENGTITRIGITCALCHSTVDDSVAPGIGKRLDGHPNRTLNPGAIIALPRPAGVHRAARRAERDRRRRAEQLDRGQVRRAVQSGQAEQSRVDPARVRARRRRARDVHRRRSGLVLERVRRGHPDGCARLVR
jgi:hypothetical protein